MKRLLLAIAAIIALQSKSQQLNIVPAPASVQLQKGNFILSASTVIVATNKGEQATADFLNTYLKTFYGIALKTVSKQPLANYISLTTPTFIRKPDNEERYALSVSAKNISIQGDSRAGTFYGMQTLIQLLPVEKPKTAKLLVPCVQVEDQPRFAYRGMHLDVSRHFFPVSYVKKYIDYIALHKMNYFHWHLTDDQGWRIEIKKYPKLTSIGAWRDGTIIGRFPGTGNDSTRHGGYYTQEQVKEIVRYAADRYITVLPEIEMPGHSMAALAAYPELGTTPDIKSKVAMTWGLNGKENNVFAPTETTFKFLEDVLTEVIELFPSQMIHIGGDECSKIWWKKDSISQQLMREKGLKNEDELQSYFIQRMEKFVNSKGRKIIGWDEILEGGLAPNALVMSWTGEKGGVHAAKEKHQAVMTPGGWCYFDHSQTKNEDSVTIGSYLPLEKVYGYEPIPKELNDSEATYILGAQANLWTEYVGYPSKVEYMIFPRMSALSEVLWSGKDKRNWQDFERRLPVQIKRYELWKANYSRAYYEIQSSILPTANKEGLLLTFKSKLPNSWLKFYTLDGTSSMGKDSLTTTITKSGTYKTELIQPNATGDRIKIAYTLTQKFSFNKATGKTITANIPPSASYPGNGGIFSLVNGVKSERGINSSEWCGWSGKEVELLIDLGKEQEVKTLNVHVLQQKASWIYPPESISASATFLTDSKPQSDRTVKTFDGKWLDESTIQLTFPPNTKSQFIKIWIDAVKKIPEGNAGAGKPAWVFIDEIEVN